MLKLKEREFFWSLILKFIKRFEKIGVLRASSVAMFVKSIVVLLDKLITVFVVLVTVAVIVAVSTAPNKELINRKSRRFYGPVYF